MQKKKKNDCQDKKKNRGASVLERTRLERVRLGKMMDHVRLVLHMHASLTIFPFSSLSRLLHFAALMVPH
jgi:hypothetical protein